MTDKRQPDALDIFTDSPTPSNAVALAIADHRATCGGLTDWPFVDALRLAEKRCYAYPKLIVHMKELSIMLGDLVTSGRATNGLRELATKHVTLLRELGENE